MRILLISLNWIGQGTYWRAFQFGRHLAKLKHDVTLLATSRSQKTRVKEQIHEGIKLIETPDLFSGSLRSGWDPWNTMNRINCTRQRTFDLVHAFESRPTVVYPALFISYRQHTPLVMDWADWFGRGGSVEERPNPIVRTILRPVETYFENQYRTRPSGTTVINNFLRERAIHLGVNPENILLLRNGSDVSIPTMKRSIARKLVDFPDNGVLIGFLGRTYLQDAKLMAQAINLTLKEIPNANLLLVGNFNREIEKWVSNPDAIIRTGPVELNQLYNYLAACDLCWLPLTDSGANRGRWPLKLNNYMTVGRPILVTNVGDLGQVVSRYGLGVVTSPDPIHFSAQTIALLRDEERRKNLGEQARRAAEDMFSWDHLTTKLEIFYEHILNEKNAEI